MAQRATLALFTNAASRVRDWRPEPPTPTRSALPRGMRSRRAMRTKWQSASSKSTRLVACSLWLALNFAMCAATRSRSVASSATGSYTRGAGSSSPVSGSSPPRRMKSTK